MQPTRQIQATVVLACVGVAAMLRIRPEQMEALEQAAVRRFETETARHLSTFAPEHSEILGEEGVRKVVGLGIERARRYGFTNRGPARFYVEMMFLFGSDFDTDPQLPWAAQILADAGAHDQMARADRLWRRTTDFLERVAGPDHEFTRDALRRARQQSWEGQPVLHPNLEQEVLRGLEALHPQRFHCVGGSALRALIERGAELAKPYAAARAAALPLFTGLMFLLGHGVATDPQFPWVEAALSDEGRRPPAERLQRLHAAWMAYLDRVLA